MILLRHSLESLLIFSILFWLGSFIGSASGPNRTSLLFNVSLPEFRGTLGSLYSLTDHLGAALGVFVSTFFLQFLNYNTVFYLSLFFYFVASFCWFRSIQYISSDEKSIETILQTRFDEIKHILDYTLYSESEHRKARLILREEIESNELWKAWAYYVNIQQSFASRLFGGWRRAAYEKNEPKTFKEKKKNLDLFKDRLEDIYISCTDAIKCIEQWDSPQTCFYIDPPYINAVNGHYDGYSEEDYKELIEKLGRNDPCPCGSGKCFQEMLP